MGLFDRFTKRSKNNTNNGDIIQRNSTSDVLDPNSIEKAIAKRAEEVRLEDCLKVSFNAVSALGLGFANMIPLLKGMALNATGGRVYMPINMKAGDILKKASKGVYYGAHVTKKGASVMTKWVEVGTQAAADFNPAMMIMAAMLVSINSKLDGIQKTQQSILSFLEQDKQAEMQADLNVLTDTLSGYEHNWDNDQYKTNHHIKVLDIKQTSEKNIIFYQSQIATAIEKLPKIHAEQAVSSGVKKLTTLFHNYRMAMYLFGFSSFLEVMLLENFREDYLNQVADKVHQYNEHYQSNFIKCRDMIKSYSSASVEKQVLDGIGNMSKALGKLIEFSPVLSKGPVDEWLHDSGEKLLKGNEAGAEKTAAEFDVESEIGNEMFIESIRSVEMICNHTTDVLFDNETLYFAVA